MMDRHIKAPLNDDEVKMLKAGDYVYISGTIYTARDAAHKRMYEALQNGQEVPMPLKNNIVYYMGPSPAREGRPIGSAGPTTSSRMDKYAPASHGPGIKGYDRKRKAFCRSSGSNCEKWRCLFCSSRRGRRTFI